MEFLRQLAARRRLDAVVITEEADILALTGFRCDNALLTAEAFYTDFRYLAAARRALPGYQVRNLKSFALSGKRIGYTSTVTKRRFDELVKAVPRAKFVDVSKQIARKRAVKSGDEIARLQAAQRLNLEIWRTASGRFRAGMSERDMARIIQKLMVERGEGEAFATIVCVGANAAECHHEPDDTVWNGREALLVDMGVRLNGVCSDLTRCLPPKRPGVAYRKAQRLVHEAHDAAIAAAKAGMTAAQLDRVARRIIAKGGFGKCFGHSLGHGVGLEIHEYPAVSKRSKDVILREGMVFTIEPGIYVEGNFGIRHEDMVLLTSSGAVSFT